jgi:hypothetical protein
MSLMFVCIRVYGLLQPVRQYRDTELTIRVPEWGNQVGRTRRHWAGPEYQMVAGIVVIIQAS